MACSTTIRSMSRREISSTLRKKSTAVLSRTSTTSLTTQHFWQQRYKMRLMHRARAKSSQRSLLLAMRKPSAIWTDIQILQDIALAWLLLIKPGRIILNEAPKKGETDTAPKESPTSKLSATLIDTRIFMELRQVIIFYRYRMQSSTGMTRARKRAGTIHVRPRRLTSAPMRAKTATVMASFSLSERPLQASRRDKLPQRGKMVSTGSSLNTSHSTAR